MIRFLLKIFMRVLIELYLCFACWCIALFACERRKKVDWYHLKLYHSGALAYKICYRSYLDDTITEEEHTKDLNWFLNEM